MWGAPGEEKALQMPAANGLLLAYHEERYGRICEKMPQLPSASQLDSHSPVERKKSFGKEEGVCVWITKGPPLK